MSLYHNIYCDGCGEQLNDGDVISALVIAKVARVDYNGESVRLKLAEDAINSRALSIYCKKCIEVEDYIDCSQTKSETNN